MQKLIILLVWAAFSCGKPLPQLEGIDMKQWKADKLGCSGFREKSLDIFSSQKNKLKGLSEADILQLLGRPDQNELYKRNQKFFYYFVESSSKCDSSKTDARRLSIRFNAMEMAKEVVIE
ncbi:MAG: hypothetical protein HYR67_18505 [Bacteroidetes bacterium]|nr:hypothetical protein [Bacteroidota bacterium]